MDGGIFHHWFPTKFINKTYPRCHIQHPHMEIHETIVVDVLICAHGQVFLNVTKVITYQRTASQHFVKLLWVLWLEFLTNKETCVFMSSSWTSFVSEPSNTFSGLFCFKFDFCFHSVWLDLSIPWTGLRKHGLPYLLLTYRVTFPAPSAKDRKHIAGKKKKKTANDIGYVLCAI